jgi:predicted transcriptional regulator
LKRHLRTAHGMTPKQYREKWGLPDDYPLTAPAYSESRSKMAKTLGLGRKAGTKIVRRKRRTKK